MKHGFQKTIADRVEVTGSGVHSAAPARIVIHPADSDHGVVFLRTGLQDGSDHLIEADWRNVRQTALCTVIGDRAGATIATVEHLMAAFAGLGLDNVLVEIDGPETPIMDGSAAQFVAAIDSVGLVTQARRRKFLKVLKSVYVEHGRARAELKPWDAGFRVDVEIDFEGAAIGRQRRVFDIDPQIFRSEIAKARTFGFVCDVKKLWAAGFALGSNLDNSVAIDGDRVLNPEGLRYRDEFVRHKALDVVGDLALAGAPILGAYVAHRPGHSLNAAVLAALFADKSNYEIVEQAPRRTVRVIAPAARVAAAFAANAD
ncbi:MAG TPA: UDP-3-O-acyl-N-acetylglucosamine deacetylase [Roseiarcus sp.]|nr:UDP-3-O-acyl-N-acetylglucosamine deacetylase [Roseiarcus sp.]